MIYYKDCLINSCPYPRMQNILWVCGPSIRAIIRKAFGNGCSLDGDHQLGGVKDMEVLEVKVGDHYLMSAEATKNSWDSVDPSSDFGSRAPTKRSRVFSQMEEIWLNVRWQGTQTFSNIWKVLCFRVTKYRPLHVMYCTSQPKKATFVITWQHVRTILQLLKYTHTRGVAKSWFHRHVQNVSRRISTDSLL